MVSVALFAGKQRPQIIDMHMPAARNIQPCNANGKAVFNHHLSRRDGPERRLVPGGDIVR